MLSIENIRHYCRTCLIKLEDTNEDDTIKSVPTKKYPELEHLMQVCLAKATAGDDSLCLYAPYLCSTCFYKWFDFLKFYQLAVKTDDKIRKILEKEVLKTESIEDENNCKINKDIKKINEYFMDSETLVDIREVEKYETTSPFYTDFQSNNQKREGDFPLVDPPNNNGETGNEIMGNAEEVESSDVDFTPQIREHQKHAKTTRSLKNKNLTNSLCKLKIKYATRKSFLKHTDEQESSEITNENSKDVGYSVSKKVRYQCQQCNKYFWEKNKYDGHMKQIHEGIRRPFKCPQCDKAYNLYKTLLQHKRECHSEKSQEIFKCDKCDKVFKTAVILKQHMANKHSDHKEAMRSICDQCGFIAAHQYSLSRHIINKHTETDQIKCEQCPKVFKTQYSLKYHIIGNHNPTNAKPFKCTECQMGFTRKTLLNQHKRTHLKYTERIKCDFEGCEVRFVKHGDKTHHMRLVHLKVKQHICDFCGEAFGAMQTLRHHRFIHTGEKPYKCNVCGQGFRQRTAMKTHRKTHFGKDSENQEIINNLPEMNLSLVNTLRT